MIAGFMLVMMGACAKLIGDHISLWQIILARQTVMLIFVLPLLRRQGLEGFKTPVLGLHMIRVALAAGAIGGTLYAVRHLQIADATALGFSKVLFATLAAWCVFGESFGIRRAAATVCGFIGVLIILNPGGDTFNIAGLVAILGAMSAGLVVNVLRRLARIEPTERMILYQSVMLGLLVAPCALYYWTWPSLVEWGLLIMVGVFAFAAQNCSIRGYRLGEASYVAPMDYFRLLPAVVIGIVLFQEQPSWNTFLGAALIIASSIYTTMRERQLKKQQTAEA